MLTNHCSPRRQMCGDITHFSRTVVSYDNDIHTAMQIHLLQAVHQLPDDVINLPQGVVQLQVEKKKYWDILENAMMRWRKSLATSGKRSPHCWVVPVDVQRYLAAPSGRRKRTACRETAGGLVKTSERNVFWGHNEDEMFNWETWTKPAASLHFSGASNGLSWSAQRSGWNED